MRVSGALVFLCLMTSIANADVVPTAALHLGGSYTSVHDEYVYEGEPTGVGPAIEASVGVRFHAQWSASVFAGYGQFTTALGFENQAMSGVDVVDTTYRHVMVGAGVTWRPLTKLLVGAGVRRAFVTEVDDFPGAQDITFRSTLVGGELGVVLYEQKPVRVQLSLGLWLGVKPAYDHALLATIPLALGVAWN
jgi:hypothetical protein